MPVHFLRRYISEFVEAAKGHRAWLSEPSTAPVCAEVICATSTATRRPSGASLVAAPSAPRAADDEPSLSLELRAYFIDAGLGALVVSAR
jgi:hypothetical protein